MGQTASIVNPRSWYWVSDFAFGWAPPLPRAAELKAQLNQLNKTELVDLACQMMAYYPDLENLLVTPPAEEAGVNTVAEEKVIQRQIRTAFHRLAGKRGAAYALALEASDILARGERYLAAREWPKALTVFETVIRELLEYHDLLEDSEDALVKVIYQANSWLSCCLEVVSNPDFRQRGLRVMFDTYTWDVTCGGTDLGTEILDLILRYTTPSERQTVIQWLYTALPTGDSWRDNFRRRIYSEGLAKLQAA